MRRVQIAFEKWGSAIKWNLMDSPIKAPKMAYWSHCCFGERKEHYFLSQYGACACGEMGKFCWWVGD